MSENTPKIYEASTDSYRPATQEDIDKLIDIRDSAGNWFMEQLSYTKYTDLKYLRMAIYPNPMRQDCVFVCEDKPISPYRHCQDVNGNPSYPSTPQGAMGFPAGIKPDLAKRVVVAVNACAGIPTEALEQDVVQSLIKILEVFTNAVVALPHDLRPITYSICNAREIIAKARGQT